MDSSVPWIATALFAAHPTHIESVVWISGRKDLLMGVFCLLAIPPFVASLASSHPRSKWIAAGWLVLAGLSKGVTIAVLGPLWLLAYAHSRARHETRHLWRATRQTAMVALLPLAMFAAFLASSEIRGFGELDPHDWTTRPLIILGGEVLLALVPYPLSMIYAPYGPLKPIYLALGIAATACFAASAWVFFRRGSVFGFAGLFFFLLVLPVLQFVPFRTTSMIADRYIFLPLFGLSLALAYFTTKAFGERSIHVVGAAAVVLLGLAAARAIEWRNPEAMYASDLARTRSFPATAPILKELAAPMNHVAFLLKKAQVNGGNMPGADVNAALAAMSRAQMALRLPRPTEPDMAVIGSLSDASRAMLANYRSIEFHSGPHAVLGFDAALLALRHERFEEAEHWASMAVDTPGLPMSHVGTAYKYLGMSRLFRGKTAEAIQAFRQALAASPPDEGAACYLTELSGESSERTLLLARQCQAYRGARSR